MGVRCVGNPPFRASHREGRGASRVRPPARIRHVIRVPNAVVESGSIRRRQKCATRRACDQPFDPFRLPVPRGTCKDRGGRVRPKSPLSFPVAFRVSSLPEQLGGRRVAWATSKDPQRPSRGPCENCYLSAEKRAPRHIGTSRQNLGNQRCFFCCFPFRFGVRECCWYRDFPRPVAAGAQIATVVPFCLVVAGPPCFCTVGRPGPHKRVRGMITG